MGRAPRRNYAGEMLQSMTLMEQMQNRRDLTDEKLRRDKELEQAKERELTIKETAADETEVGRRFSEKTGLALDAETRKYAKPIEENVREKAQLRRSARALPVEYEEQNILEKLAGKPKVPMARTTPEMPTIDSEAVKRQITDQIKADTRLRLEKYGFIGEANKNHPSFDQGIHDLFTSDEAPLVAPSKVLEEVKTLQAARSATSAAKTAASGARVAKESEDADIRDRQLKPQVTDQTLAKGILDNEMARLKNAYEPQRQRDEHTISSLNEQLKTGELLMQPLQKQKLQKDITLLEGNIRKNQQDFDKHQRKSVLGRQYELAVTDADRERIAMQMAIEDGHAIDVEKFKGTKLNDAVSLSLESSKAYIKAKEIQINNPKDIAGIKSYTDMANIAAARSATLYGADMVTQYNVKTDAGYGLGEPTGVIDSVRVGRNYALIKQRGQVKDYIYAPIPEGATPEEIRDNILPGQAAILGWSLIDNFPELRGNIKAFDAKLDQVPGINPELQKLAKSYMARQMGKQAQDEQDSTRAATLRGVETEPDRLNALGQGELTQGQPRDYKRPERQKTIYGRPEDETKVPAKLKPVEQRKGKEVKNSEKEVKGPNDSETIKNVKNEAIEIYNTEKRFKMPKDASFPEWLAEQGKRLKKNPGEFTASEISSFWKLWDRK